MRKLSPREQLVYDMIKSGCRNDVAIMQLGMSENEFNVLKTGMRRKIADAEAFLECMKPVLPMLYPKRQYKGISEPKRRRT
jgi:hypothetical protein